MGSGNYSFERDHALLNHFSVISLGGCLCIGSYIHITITVQILAAAGTVSGEILLRVTYDMQQY